MGLFTARIKIKELARLTRRMGISLQAGVDVRKMLEREATGSGRPVFLDRLGMIKERVDAGGSFADAVDATGEFFPLLFREMVRLGEETGHLPAVLTQMADHYDAAMRQQKAFLAAIFGPMVQLVIAVCIIGFLIWITSFIKNDILQIGLTGTAGVIVWFGMAGLVAFGLVSLWRAFYLDLPWTRAIKRLLFRVPAISHAVTLISMTRLTWALSLTFNSGMDVRHAIRLGLRASMHPDHLDQERNVNRLVEEGLGVYETFVQMGCFDSVFLDSLRAGEEAGMIAESMAHLSRTYQERALVAIAALSIAASWAVWILVAGFIIFFIFRIFGTYVNAISGA